MKTVAKIIAYCIWFGFALWLSFWFSMFASWIAWKLVPAKIWDHIELPIMWILWAGFVCLLALLPILWMRKRGVEIVQMMVRNVIFIVLLLGSTIFCTFVWDKFIADKLYNCTDEVGLDFLQPGNWIHGNYITVSQIVTGRSMSEPDTIKQGWSIPKLWLLWLAFVFVSVAVSASLSFLTFRSRKSKIAQTISP
jgi:hypothetical protein